MQHDGSPILLISEDRQQVFRTVADLKMPLALIEMWLEDNQIGELVVKDGTTVIRATSWTSGKDGNMAVLMLLSQKPNRFKIEAIRRDPGGAAIEIDLQRLIADADGLVEMIKQSLWPVESDSRFIDGAPSSPQESNEQFYAASTSQLDPKDPIAEQRSSLLKTMAQITSDDFAEIRHFGGEDDQLKKRLDQYERLARDSEGKESFYADHSSSIDLTSDPLAEQRSASINDPDLKDPSAASEFHSDEGRNLLKDEPLYHMLPPQDTLPEPPMVPPPPDIPSASLGPPVSLPEDVGVLDAITAPSRDAKSPDSSIISGDVRSTHEIIGVNVDRIRRSPISKKAVLATAAVVAFLPLVGLFAVPIMQYQQEVEHDLSRMSSRQTDMSMDDATLAEQTQQPFRMPAAPASGIAGPSSSNDQSTDESADENQADAKSKKAQHSSAALPVVPTGDADSMMKAAQDQLTAGHLDDAIKIYLDAVTRFPHNSKLRITVFNVLMRAGDYAKAKALCLDAVNNAATQEERSLFSTMLRTVEAKTDSPRGR